MKGVATGAAIIGQSVLTRLVMGLLVFGRTDAAPAEQDMLAGSRRIVSQHKAVFNKLPAGLAPYSTAAILLGNGDIAMSISATPPEKGATPRKQQPGRIRFWFHKNDMWGRGARSVALIDAVFDFDPAKPEPKFTAETDLYTAITSGTVAQQGGVTVHFRIWVSAVDNMIFMEFAAENGTIPFSLHPQVMKEINRRTKVESGVAEVREPKGFDGIYLRRELEKESQAAASLCMRRFGAGERDELDRNRQVLVFAIDSRAKNPHFAIDVEKKMSAFDLAAMPVQLEAHKKWWADFWAESFVEIPDKVIERQYYLANYLFASSCRDKEFPPGILGSWFCTDGPGWGNDYHLNYNYQAAFYSLYGSNHVALGEVQDQPLLDFMPSARKLAASIKMPGILYPVGIIPKGQGGGNTYNQKSNGAYGAVNMIFRWKTTRDPDYAKKVYPYFKELTAFWEAYLTFEKDKDRYVIANDSIHEQSGDDFNPIVSLALVRAVFDTALELSATLAVDQAKREQWNHILTHLSNYATREVDGKTIFRYSEIGTEYWDNNTLGIQHIYPALGIGLESSPELIGVSINTLDYMQRWFDNNGDTSFFPAAAWLGYHPEVIYAKLHEFVATQYRPNGMRNNKHGMEKVATIPNTVNLMLCSVHQDVMRLFLAWPKAVDARFANLRQFGAFLVTSALENGEVRYVNILSEKGRPCTLVNPWPDRQVTVKRDDGRTETVSGARFTLDTRINENLSLTPRPK
jgi:alpha-L-fucosidase 2